MDVSPRDLRSPELHEAFRGYARHDVDQLLGRAAKTIDRLHERIRELGERVAAAESEADRSREVEETLRRVLVAAQRTADQLTAESQQQAQDRLFKADARSSALIQEGESRSSAMLEDATTRSRAMLTEAETRSAALLEGATTRSRAMLTEAETRSAALLQDAETRSAALMADAESRSTSLVAEAQARSSELLSGAEREAAKQAKAVEEEHRAQIDRLSERRDALGQEIEALGRSRDGFLARLEAAYRSELEELSSRRRSLRPSGGGAGPGNGSPEGGSDEIVVDEGSPPAEGQPRTPRPERFSTGGRRRGDAARADLTGEVKT